MQETIECDFIFVPDGTPWPTEWVAEHPEHLVIPARFERSPAFMRRVFPKKPAADADRAGFDLPMAQSPDTPGVRYAADIPRQHETVRTDAVPRAPISPAHGDRHDPDPPARPQPHGYLSYDEIAMLVHGNNLAPVDDSVIIAMAYMESRFNADEKTPGGSSTATGLMQINDGAIKQIQHVYPPSVWRGLSRAHPSDAIQLATLYLRYLIDRSGSVEQGLFRYGDQTKTYVPKVLAASDALRNQPVDPLQVLRREIGR